MRSSLSLFAAIAALVLPLNSLRAAPLDVSPADGLPDIWAYANGAIGLNPSADDDGDGQSNLAESIAGSNPKVANDMIRFKSWTRNGGNVTLVFPAMASKRYEIVASNTPNAADFVPLSPPSLHTPSADGDLTVTVSAGSRKYFCVTVKDLDSDNDGLTNYEERILGLNANLADSNGDGVSDFAYVSSQLALPDTVTVKATSVFASEDGQVPGTFEIVRTRTLFPISVPYAVSGTATPATDYIALSGVANFAQGQDRVVISVNPNVESPNVVEGGESVVVTLLPPPPNVSGAYTLGTATTAAVIIGETTVASGTGLRGRYYDHASGLYADGQNFGQTGTYAYTRTSTGSPNTGVIVVPFAYNGSPALQVGHVVRMSFTSGPLALPALVHQNYTVTGVNAGVNFTAAISAPTLPNSGNGNLGFSVQSFPHPALIDRVDPVVDFDWWYGTPNDVAISPNNPVDNISAYWEGYLSPTTAGTYTFQLDADDRARVLLDTGSGLTEILEHGWDGAATPETVGTFKLSAPIVLAVPASSAQRYRIRVEWVDATGDARCRLQWRLGTNAFANIPQAQVFSHTSAVTYSYTRTVATAGAMAGNIVVTQTGHPFAVGSQVDLSFSTGNLFTPTNGNFHGLYTVTATTASTYTVDITGATLPGSGTGSGFVVNPASTTTGWYSRAFTNTDLSGAPGRVGVDSSGPVTLNNGIWGSGTPDPVLIQKDTFTIRWSGQVQPQYSEEYTFVVQANDGCTLRINGQVQDFKVLPSSSLGFGYIHDSLTGNTLINYAASSPVPGSYRVGEVVRIDPTSGGLNHAPATPPTYSYDATTGIMVVNYANLTTVTPGGFVAGEVVEIDPTSGTNPIAAASVATLANTPYTILADPAPTTNTFAVMVGANRFASETGNININDIRNAVITALHAGGIGTYNYANGTGDAVIDYSSMIAAGFPSGSFAVGNTVHVDPTSGNASNSPYAARTITAATATTFTVNLGAGAFSSGTGNVTIVDPRTGIVPDHLTTAFTVNVGAGKYANNTVGGVNTETVNKSLRDWSSNGTERYVRVPMIAGTRYDFQLDYWESGTDARCRLWWFSPSQPRQIIPRERLYPDSTPGITMAPPVMTSATSATALVGGPFNYLVGESNGGTVSVTGNPAWLTLNGRLLSGTPPAGATGSFQILVTSTGPNGTSTSVINLEVAENAGTIAREFWTGVAGNAISSIPTGTAPTGTANLSSLEAPTDFGDNYGARIRGYITAPTTGNYYFWIAASNTAELRISNDEEPVNLFKRASVNTGSATPRNWSAEPNQKSPWMALEEGKRYFIEILHKAGTGAGDNLAVGWSKPGEATTAPTEVIPGYVLSPWIAPNPNTLPGTLFVSTMRAQDGAITNGVGTSTLRLSADESVAYVKFNYNGLTGDLTDWHVHNDPYLAAPSGIIYDGVEPVTAGDGLITDPNDPNFGSHRWTILGVGALSAADIRELLKQGKAYINLHSAMYPNGEIRGNYTFANGTRTFTPPPAPPSWTDDGNTNNGASRFLTQATFGPNAADIAALKAIVPSGGKTRYELWIENQFTIPASVTLPEVLRTERSDAQGGSAFDETLVFNSWWRNSVTGADQLRQRVAFALSQIHVVSAQGPLDNNGRALASYYDHLNDHAFGNFRDILEATTLHWAMGRYLDMFRNDKPDLTTGRIPNENYAREIKQLFSVGLFRMWPDGSLVLNSKDELIDTYTQREIVGYAKAFTGWDYGYDGAFRTAFGAPADFTRPMREVPARHFTGPKRILHNEVLPGLDSANGQPLDPFATHPTTVINDPAYQALPGQELDATHDQLFDHPNVGPFICRQLIQRMVTSHPSRDYLYRVVQKFNDNGSGVRGDMKAVIKAILLDYEARSNAEKDKPAFGKQREPVLRVAAAGRAFRPAAITGTYVQSSTASNALAITLNTGTVAHRLNSGNTVFLEFTSGSPEPFDGAYGVTGVTTNTFTVNAPGWASGTWSQPANSQTMTVSMSNHWLGNGNKCYIDFRTVSASTMPVDGVYTVTTSGGDNGNSFTLVNPVTSTSNRTGTLIVPRFNPGSYVSAASGLPAPNERRVTMDTNTDHHLNVGDKVYLNFSGGNPRPTDMEVTVDTVVDKDTYTFLATATGTNLGTNQGNNGVWQFPLQSQPLNRSGTFTTRPSTFQLNGTDGDIDQSPLNSPTVFNFYLPDFKFPGALASQGITTPEFQETAETSVIRQVNFFERGIFALSNDYQSSFRSGSNAIVMDFAPWMAGNATNLGLGSPTTTGRPWTQNENLDQLLVQMNSLLTGGSLPATLIQEIRDHVAMRISSVGTGTTSCTVTTIRPHGYATGDQVCISGITNGTFGSSVNSTSTARAITVTGANTFTFPVSCSAAPTSTGLTNAHVSPIAYNNGSTSPSFQERRNRLRAILHFIYTSPDFTIQR